MNYCHFLFETSKKQRVNHQVFTSQILKTWTKTFQGKVAVARDVNQMSNTQCYKDLYIKSHDMNRTRLVQYHLAVPGQFCSYDTWWVLSGFRLHITFSSTEEPHNEDVNLGGSFLQNWSFSTRVLNSNTQWDQFSH